MKPIKYIANHLRTVLINGASAPHTAEVEHFFKNEVQSRGWYTNELRKLARRFSRTIANDAGIDYLFNVCDELFRGKVLEEKVLSVLMLEDKVSQLEEAHFKRLTGWLDRVSTWADHDALASYLLGPLMVAESKRVAHALRWAKAQDTWHRRAAAVSLIRGVRKRMFARETKAVTAVLLRDEDLMVQKGLGWLLREQAKYDRERALPLLRSIRNKAPGLVLRTACETLTPELKVEIMGNRSRANARTIRTLNTRKTRV
ncbi:MAG: DNA alkylation repair protein [Acidobacteriaceae bacterium]